MSDERDPVEQAYIAAARKAGIEVDDDAGICDECGKPNADNGEGYDGLCGDCADKAEAEGKWE